MKIYAIGSYNAHDRSFKMFAPHTAETSPLNEIVYLGYSFPQMQKAYRERYGLKYKRIEWVITGLVYA